MYHYLLSLIDVLSYHSAKRVSISLSPLPLYLPTYLYMKLYIFTYIYICEYNIVSMNDILLN